MNHSELSHMASAVDDSTINIVVVIILLLLLLLKPSMRVTHINQSNIFAPKS